LRSLRISVKDFREKKEQVSLKLEVIMERNLRMPNSLTFAPQKKLVMNFPLLSLLNITELLNERIELYENQHE